MLECIAYIASNARVIADDKLAGEGEGRDGYRGCDIFY
jgi:hypothetical protein